MKFLCQNTPSGKEWSGLFFYDTNTKNIFDDDLVITPTEFVLLDVGSEVFTDFTTNGYFIQKMGEYDKYTSNYGLLHSHHNMGVTPSSTDNATTHSMAEEMPVFLTVIINNKYDINAKIATIVTVETEEKINLRDLNGEKKVVSIVPEEKKILYYRQLDLAFDKIQLDDVELKKRIEFLIEEKKAKEKLEKATNALYNTKVLEQGKQETFFGDDSDYSYEEEAADNEIKTLLGYSKIISIETVLKKFFEKYKNTKDFLKLTNEITINLNEVLKDSPEIYYTDAIDELIESLEFYKLHLTSRHSEISALNFVNNILKKKLKSLNE